MKTSYNALRTQKSRAGQQGIFSSDPSFAFANQKGRNTLFNFRGSKNSCVAKFYEYRSICILGEISRKFDLSELIGGAIVASAEHHVLTSLSFAW
jgi:hypothetical protein